MAEYCRKCGKLGSCAEGENDEAIIKLPRRKIKTKGNSAENPLALSENLPSAARDIYMEAYRKAYIEHQIDDGQTRTKLQRIAHETATMAVANKYHKGSDGKWQEK